MLTSRLIAVCVVSAPRSRLLFFRGLSSSSGFGDDTFLDSQSGLKLTRPQRNFVRIHELSTSTSPLSQSESADIPLTNALNPAYTSAPKGLMLFAPIGSEADAAALRGARVGTVGATVTLQLPLTAKALKEGIALVSAASGGANKLRVRVVLDGAFAVPDDADAVEDVVARVADANAAIIVLAGKRAVSVQEEADDDDDVRDAIERAFNLDVAGDALLERLAVRGSSATLAAALRAGVRRVDVHATGAGGLATPKDVATLAAAGGLSFRHTNLPH